MLLIELSPMSKANNRITTSKYNKYTFLPLNIYHQCSKPSNMFFLITLILLCIPQISPFNPYSYLLAFCLVTGTSMLKDGVEDFRKHKQDKMINHKKSYIVDYDQGDFISRDIYVECLDIGDFVIIGEGDIVPADVIVLRSKMATKKGVVCRDFCYIDSSNLDGESNLKKKTSHYNIDCNLTSSSDNISNGVPRICECDKFFVMNVKNPQTVDTGDVFTKFECKLEVKGEIILCNEKNVLLKGTILKNTVSVLAYVVAVGHNTKMGKSNVHYRKSHSLFETEVGKLIYVIFVVYFILLVVSSILGSLFLRKTNIEYLYLNEFLTKDALRQTGTNYILFSYLIPLSLFVTLEVSRMFHSSYISHDRHLKKNDVSSSCGNSSVTEDLGMIEFLLSDKTGTLTKNNMVFKFVHLSGDSTIRAQDSHLQIDKYDCKDIVDLLETDTKIKFIMALLCCNAVDSLNGVYEGISQDEISILEGLKKNGIVLLEREDKCLHLSMNGEKLSVSIELTLDFTSARQRMSILTKIGDKHYLFTKGSDSMLIGKKQMKVSPVSDNEATAKQRLSKIITTNSKYRSLVVGYKELSPHRADVFKRRFNAITLENRQQQEENIFNEYEKGMQYLGTTFIEDELEDEVPDTLSALKQAGIKIWMITGDKKETAVSCAIDCGIMNSVDEENVLVIEGDDFTNTAGGLDITSFNAVVVYRSTPYMKGKIAKMFRDIKRNTMAVGDGNNDVGMLQTANIGVGILGKEGNQAGIAGDIAIPGFYCLKKLLLVHGRYNFIRFSKVTLNAFYKNIYFITIQFLYNFYTGFSGKPVYSNYFLTYYNVFFTSMVPATIALFDKDIPEDVALENPQLYSSVRAYFSKTILLLGTVYAIFEGIVVFFLVTGVFFKTDLVSHNGKVGGYIALNNLFSIIVFTSVIIKQIKLVSFITTYTYIAIILSVFFCFLCLFLLQDRGFRGSMWILVSIPSFYFLFMMMILTSYILTTFYNILFDYALRNQKRNEGFCKN